MTLSSKFLFTLFFYIEQLASDHINKSFPWKFRFLQLQMVEKRQISNGKVMRKNQDVIVE